MAIYAIIPARLQSTRLPRKMLLDATGKPLIQHTWENVSKSELIDTVLVATDSEEIAQAVRGFGGRVAMTPPCRTGSDRCQAALVTAGIHDADFVVNVQGDWPEILPDDIDRTLDALCRPDDPWLLQHGYPDVVTLAFPSNAEWLNDRSKVNVVCTEAGRVLYFSRAHIPYNSKGAIHAGIYSYTRNALCRFAEYRQTPLELDEELEQLRALEIGLSVRVIPTARVSYGIDTQADYDAFVERMKNKNDAC